MQPSNLCQSCSMPLENPEMHGTEKDGTKSKEYCSYCYQNGAFINPLMTLKEMKILIKEMMEKMKIDSKIIDVALNTLPTLKRWKVVPASAQ